MFIKPVVFRDLNSCIKLPRYSRINSLCRKRGIIDVKGIIINNPEYPEIILYGQSMLGFNILLVVFIYLVFIIRGLKTDLNYSRL